MVDGPAEERFERGVVFLCRRAVDPWAVGEEPGRVFNRFGQEQAGEEDVGCCYIAGHDPRGAAAWFVGLGCGVVGAIGLRGQGVV